MVASWLGPITGVLGLLWQAYELVKSIIKLLQEGQAIKKALANTKRLDLLQQKMVEFGRCNIMSKILARSWSQHELVAY